MIKEKCVSVIIPFYSGVEWLCEAVDSALNQTYKNIEIIVVNDGSPEDITEFLNKYGELVRYFYKENGGAGSARNLGMKNASGDYFAFLDSDDIWLPEKTEKQIRFMQEIGAMWTHTGFTQFYPSGKSKKMNQINNYENIFIQSFISMRTATPTVIIDRRCLVEHPEICFPDMKKGQDTVFFRKLSFYYPIGQLTESLVRVRMRDDVTCRNALLRFKLNSEQYRRLREEKSEMMSLKYLTPLTKVMYEIYSFYNKIFGFAGKFVNYNMLEKLAKIFWIVPFVVGKISYKLLTLKQKKNKKFLK